MTARTRAPGRRAGVLVAAASLLIAGFTAVSPVAAEEEGSNNLSIPTLYVGSVGVGSPTCTTADDHQLPTGTKGVDTSGDGTADDHLAYYVQAVATWQADCDLVAAGQLVTPSWGDNLTGAPLKVGTPVRIELGLLGTAPATLNTKSFNVVKLDADALDRESHYGTLGDYLAVPEIRVWAPGTYTIVDSDGDAVVPEQTMGAEVNSTGRVVYGEQFTFDEAGTYTVIFESTSVNFGTATAPDHDTSIDLLVSATSGGGGGGGNRPDNPGGGGGGPQGPRR